MTNQVRAVPKPIHKRNSKKRKQRGEFSKKTLQQIYERDDYKCVRCGSPYLDTNPHHIIFRSQGGLGTVDNGVSVCRTCHTWAHSCREGRVWFEEYRKKFLLGGD